MISFQVNDMTCGHCVGAITKAVQSIDPEAKVHIDLATHRVDIEPAASNALQLVEAIQQAGYAPERLAGGALPVVQPAPRSGCCCR